MTPELAAAIVTFLGALGGYIKINMDRTKTGQARDKINEMLEYKVTQLEKRADKNDKVFDKILQTLEDIKVEIAKMSGRDK